MTLPGLREKLRSPMALKLFRYSMASVVAVIVSNVCLLIFVGLMKMGVVLASTLATSIAAVPSYEMNRKWAWGKSGKSHMMKEVVPFWGLALLGWAFSTWAVWVMDGYAKRHHFSHGLQTLTVALVYLGSFGVLWVGKFIIFNRLMFVHHHDPAPEAGRQVNLPAQAAQPRERPGDGTPTTVETPSSR
ncbi:MAG TPA: GtrA family protein [Acidimicrobiales bacterium]|nr:GtrA family protein [Acidimicrobiales bacterium]